MILNLLLLAEIAYVTGAVAETCLVYTARHRNLMLSVATLGVQVGLTLAFIPLFRVLFPAESPNAAVNGIAPAAALLASALFATVVKSRLLRATLGEPVSGWRWPMLLAAGAAFAIGILVQRYLVAYWELVLGLPAILATYGIVLWYRGFEEEERLLFAGRDKLLKDREQS